MAVAVDRIALRGRRLNGELDVRFTVNGLGQRSIRFGGDMRTDMNNAVSINGVEYVACRTVSEHPTKGWRCEPGHDWGLTRTECDRWTDAKPTEQAGRKFLAWCETMAPRLAEQHSAVWPSVLSASARPDFGERRQDLADKKRRLEREAEMWDMIDLADNWRVDHYPNPVRAHWVRGFNDHNGRSGDGGHVSGEILVEFVGGWHPVGFVCVNHSRRSTFVPAELVTVRDAIERR